MFFFLFPFSHPHFSTSGGKSQTLSNVAFGDVFLCSGQSNMAFSPNLAFNATEEIADSINYPNIRMFTGEDVMANSPVRASPAPYVWLLQQL